MGIGDILLIIKSILQFPSTVLEFVKILQKTPSERHVEILKKVAIEQRAFEKTGRPTWED